MLLLSCEDSIAALSSRTLGLQIAHGCELVIDMGICSCRIESYRVQ